MLRVAISCLTAALAAVAPCILSAQSHFDRCATMTGSEGTIIIPEGADVRMNGAPAPAGSEIAVFTESGACAGAVVWRRRSMALTIWGDDTQTRVRDGFGKGESITFRIWDPSEGVEYDSAKQPSTLKFAKERSFFRGERSFLDGGIYVLTHLSIGTAGSQRKSRIGAPALRAPLDGARRQPAKVDLTWKRVEGAKRYRIQLSTSKEFPPNATSADDVTSLRFSTPRLRRDVVYYWRVRAATKAGTGPWSAVRRFRTAPDPGRGDRLAEHGDPDQLEAEYDGIAGRAVEADVPRTFALHPAYPNPFNASTAILFDVPEPSLVRIVIYNAAGAEVDVLARSEMKPGSYTVLWHADRRPSGVYFCRIQAGEWSAVRTLVLLR